MNINKEDIVYGVYDYGINVICYTYRKEKFINYNESGLPVCTVNMQDGVQMEYHEICLTEEEAKSKVSILRSGIPKSR